VRQAVAAFSNDLCRNSGTNNGAGQISLEFFQKKKGWIYQEDIPWEVWTIRCKLVHHVNEQERLGERVKVEEMLSEKVLYICQEMNKHGYVPKMPKQADEDLVFDTSYPNIHPYLFKISHTTSSMSNSPSMGTAVQRLISPLLGL
jgi:autophagy-related protein 101